MTVATRWRLARPWAGALLALLAMGVIIPASARAGCVHDALRRAQQPTGAAHFTWLIQAGAMETPAEDAMAAPASTSTPTDSTPTPIPDPNRPCSGPTCSGNPGLPPAPSASIAPGFGSWAWLGSTPRNDMPGADRLPPPEERARPVRRGPSIFHPPRPATA